MACTKQYRYNAQHQNLPINQGAQEGTVVPDALMTEDTLMNLAGENK